MSSWSRFDWLELKTMTRVFVWDLLIKRFLLVCLPLEVFGWCLAKGSPLTPWFETHAFLKTIQALPTFISIHLQTPLALMAAAQWLVYILFMFFLFRQLLNIYLGDMILRSCMQKRLVLEDHESVAVPQTLSHQCLTCYPRKIIWRLQDQGALVIHMVLGSLLFQTLPYHLDLCPVELWWLLQSYWRGYLYYQYVFTRDGCCPEGMVFAYRHVPIWWAAFQVGALDTTIDLLCNLFIPTQTLYWFIMALLNFCIVVFVQVLQVHHYPHGQDTHELFSINPVWMVWRMAQALVAGGISIAKRNPRTKTPIHAFASVHQRLKKLWSGWFVALLRRILLWPEYRSYKALVTKGPTAPYLRSQVMTVFEVVSTVRDFMKDYDKRLVLLTGITSTPIVGSWVRMMLDPRIKNVATLLKKIGPREVLYKTLDDILQDIQEPLAACDGSMDPAKVDDQQAVLYEGETIEVVRGYFMEDAYRLVDEVGDMDKMDEPVVRLGNKSKGKRSVECQTGADPGIHGVHSMHDPHNPFAASSPTPVLIPNHSTDINIIDQAALEAAIHEAISTPLIS